MLDAVTQLYRRTAAYARACPVPFLVPVATEGAQHVAEWRLGFYDGRAGALAAAHSSVRMGFGTAKVAALLLACFWVVRWLEWGDARRTSRAEPAAVATFLPLFLLQFLADLPQIWAAQLQLATGITVPLRAGVAVALASFLLALLLSDWSRTAPLGDRDGGPLRSVRRVAPVLGWAAGFNLVAVLPPMAVHYLLGYGAMRAPGLAKAVLLAADTLFVGWLGAVVAGTAWFASERARARRPRPVRNALSAGNGPAQA